MRTAAVERVARAMFEALGLRDWENDLDTPEAVRETYRRMARAAWAEVNVVMNEAWAEVIGAD